MEFKIGNKVVFIDEKGGGVVSKIDSQYVYVTDEYGFEIPKLRKQITLEKPLNQRSNIKSANSKTPTKKDEFWENKPTIPIIRTEKQKPVFDKDEVLRVKKKKKQNLVTWSRSEKGIPVVDLHLHNIIDNEIGINDHTKVLIQLEYFDKAIQDVYRHRYTDFIIVHGVGKGRLRQEVRNRLQNYPNMTFYDAPLKEFGIGATRVNVRYS